VSSRIFLEASVLGLVLLVVMVVVVADDWLLTDKGGRGAR